MNWIRKKSGLDQKKSGLDHENWIFCPPILYIRICINCWREHLLVVMHFLSFQPVYKWVVQISSYKLMLWGWVKLKIHLSEPLLEYILVRFVFVGQIIPPAIGPPINISRYKCIYLGMRKCVARPTLVSDKISSEYISRCKPYLQTKFMGELNLKFNFFYQQ